jgi:hypothetical protein
VTAPHPAPAVRPAGPPGTRRHRSPWRRSGDGRGDVGDPARLVDRELNAHSYRHADAHYDEDLMTVVLDVFSRPSTAEQPRFVAEVGCGDGSRLRDIYQAIHDRTARVEADDPDWQVELAGCVGDVPLCRLTRLQMVS